MSLLSKLKLGGSRGSKTDDAAFDEAYPVADDLALAGAGDATRSLDATTVQLNDESSIISEAAPSELTTDLTTDFTDTRVQAGEGGLAGGGSGLPLIGNRPLAEQRRLLGGALFLGLLGLVVITFVSLNTANRSANQVAASGQALMQSQRLAKSVSQALIGSPQAFPEVRESTEVLAHTVRGLKTGEGDLPAAPAGVQDALDPLMPLVDRAEKNANTVIATQ